MFPVSRLKDVRVARKRLEAGQKARGGDGDIDRGQARVRLWRLHVLWYACTRRGRSGEKYEEDSVQFQSTWSSQGAAGEVMCDPGLSPLRVQRWWLLAVQRCPT